MLKSHGNDPSMLGSAEKFFFHLSSLAGYEVRIQAISMVKCLNAD